MQHYLRNPSGQEDADGRMPHRSVGQDVDETRDFAVNRTPVFDRWPAQPGRVSDGRNVQEQVGRTAERRVNDHGVADRGVRDDGARRDPLLG